MTARVVVSGAGVISALGSTSAEVLTRLRNAHSAVKNVPQWQEYKGLQGALGAPVSSFTTPAHYTRRQTRSMGRVAMMAVRAAELGLTDAGLLGDPVVASGDTGVAFGSSMGSADAVNELAHLLIHRTTQRLNATSYVRMMSHTAPVNIDVFFGLTGRVLPTSSGGTSGSQGIGYAFEAIRDGRQKVMIAGGADELSPIAAAMFSGGNEDRSSDPESLRWPRPFASEPGGPVAGEGACALILEDYEHARARGANILCEVAGFATNRGGTVFSEPDAEALEVCVRAALADAAIDRAAIGLASACGLATHAADIAESHALHAAIGNGVPVAAPKSYFGHTMAASGALEAWLSIVQMREGWLAPTLNLTQVSAQCADLDYVCNEGRAIDTDHALSVACAVGGINTALVFRRV